MLIVVTILGAFAANFICGRKYAIASLIAIPAFCMAMTWVENTFGYQIVMLMLMPIIVIAGIDTWSIEALVYHTKSEQGWFIWNEVI